ncbi:EAL domain-containing protein [Cytobacillus sp. Hz8]|uniref:EAL domain-containing protein n=1 Tax=Cytobacillus sp. Hz8 TaxID=3347168 RepID=UPI0035DE6F30
MLKQAHYLEDKILFNEYQPLINSSNDSIFAFEALIRSSPPVNPLIMFEIARNEGFLYELDTFCIENAINQYPQSYIKKYFLFINIFPSTIIHQHFEKFIHHLIENYPNINQHVIFEINEISLEESIWEKEIFLERMSILRSLGFRIALDDLQIARSSLHKLETLSPEYIKLDHTRAKDLSFSIIRQEVVSFFLEFTHSNMKLVLEGIETKDDLIMAKRLGVPLLQGYYISKPKRL